MGMYQDAFISYGRPDSKAFAIDLKEWLSLAGFSIWLDLQDIPLGVDFQQQINDSIDRSHNFLFIISPHAVNSPYCGLEIEHACRRYKRIIPLMHVEKISRDTWQQRHPQGTEADWQAYQAAGKHTTLDNMHPAIRKLNWVFFREGVDDFERSLQGLISLFRHHQTYVQDHTHFLCQALSWESQRQHTSHLLVGEERQQAETWLTARFQDEQPPCQPTDLHCEFITESIKNANNLMTQVFLAHAEADADTMAQIRRSLWRAGVTVWTSQRDIPTGEDFQQAIERGIEQADNLVYLLSPAAMQSKYCQMELDYACRLNKRIIPILVSPTPAELVPEQLQGLQYVDLTDNVVADDYWLDESQLLRILATDAAYYERHKVLLAKALKWQRQHRNPSILLRGYNLRQAETWLQLAQQNAQYPPTPIHAEFIAESLRQPPDTALDVFISYSRADSDFARWVNDALQAQGKRTWFDQESIAAGTADFKQEIHQGIEASDNFLFILSPRSVNSPYCSDEVEYAAHHKKRFVTILHRSVDGSQLHPDLANVQWIDFQQQQEDFSNGFNQLVRVLDTDRDHVHSHTKWLQRAIEWHQQQRTADLLLRGSEAAIAKSWLQEAEEYNKQPAPTDLQIEFIQASCQAVTAAARQEKRRALILRSLLVVMTAVAALAVGSSIAAFKAQRQAQRGEIEALLESSKAQFRSGQYLDSLITSLQAGRSLQAARWLQRDPEQTLKAGVMASLHQAIHWTREQYRFEGYPDSANGVEFSSDGQTLVTSSWDNQEAIVKLWKIDGTPLKLHSQPEEIVKSAAFQPNFNDAYAISMPRNHHRVMALLGQEGTVELWKQNGELIKQLREPGVKLDGLEFSAGNQRLITYQRSDTARGDSVYLWSPTDGSLKNRIYMKPSTEYEPPPYQLSPTDQLIATVTRDQTTQLLNLMDGRLVATLEGGICGWSHDGQRLATCREEDGVVLLWQADGTPITTLKADDGNLSNVIFSPDNQTLAVQLDDGSFQLWSQTGELIRSLQSEDTPLDSDWGNLTFSPDGSWLVINYYGETSTTQVWPREGTVLKTVRNQPWRPGAQGFSADSQWLAIADAEEGEVLLLNRDGSQIKSLKGHDDAIIAIQFSPDSQTLATSSEDSTVRLWKLDGSPLMTLTGHYDWVQGIAFSPNGQLLASASADRSVKLWNVTSDGLDSLTMTNYQFGSVFSEKTGRLAEEDTLVAAMEDGSVRLWRGRPIDRSVTTLLGPTPGKSEVTLIYPATATYQHDGSMSQPPVAIQVTVKSDDTLGPVALWQPNGRLLTTVISQPIPAGERVTVQTSNDGQVFLTAVQGAGFFGPVQVWNGDGSLRATLMEQAENGQGGVQLSQDGRYVAMQFTPDVGEPPSPVLLWQSDGTLITEVQPEVAADSTAEFTFLGDSSGLVTWSNGDENYGPVQLWQTDGTLLKTLIADAGAVENIPDDGTIEVYWNQQGQVLVTAVNNQWGGPQDNPSHGPVQLWQVDGTLLETLVERTEQTRYAWVTSSPDGETFAVGLNEAGKFGQAILWNRQQPEPMTLVEPQADNSWIDILFSPDSQSLITATQGGAVQLWNWDGSLVKTLLPESQGWSQATFSPSQKYFFTVEAGSKTVSIWDRRGQSVGSFATNHKGDISQVLFSPDSRQIATASWDQTIKLWTLKGNLESVFTDHTSSVEGLRFTADGSQLVSVGDGSSKTLILRDLAGMNDLNSLLSQACEQAGNYLQQSISTTPQQQQLCR